MHITGIKIPEANSLKISFKGKRYTFSTIFTLICKKMKAKFNKKANMNPMQYWYETNKDLKQIMDNYYKNNIELLKDAKLKQDAIELYNNGNANEKIQVITLLSFIKKFLDKV